MFTVALFYIENYTELLIVLNYSLICFYILKKADFLKGLYMNKDRILAQTFSSRCRYRDAILSLENSRIGDYLHIIYPNEFKIEDTTDTSEFVLIMIVTIESITEQKITTKLYDKLLFSIVHQLQ